jgi:signal transduction histidine kinase
MSPEPTTEATILQPLVNATTCMEVAPFLRAPPTIAEVELLRAERTLLAELLAAPPQALARFTGQALGEVTALRALIARRAREPAEFLRKVRSLYRRCARLASHAHAVPVPRVAQDFNMAALAFGELAASAEPSGDEFLPAQALLEAALLTVSLVAVRIGVQAPTRRRVRRTHLARTGPVKVTRGAFAAPQLGLALHQLAERVAQEQGKRIELSLLGLEHVPHELTGAVFDISTQLLRNAVQHGVEAPAHRSELGKPAAGVVMIEFRRHGRALCELCVQDDGQGLQPEELVQAGVKGERGQGLGIVGDRLKALKGHLQVSSRPGQFTRVRIRMPCPDEVGQQPAAQAKAQPQTARR